MKWVWTWEGKSFGYLEDDDLWTHDGRHVARRAGDEFYDGNGKYLGEIMNEDRLITNTSKSTWTGGVFALYGNRGAVVKFADYSGFSMLGGHKDFPKPDEL